MAKKDQNRERISIQIYTGTGDREQEHYIKEYNITEKCRAYEHVTKESTVR